MHHAAGRLIIFEGPEAKAEWLDANASLDASTRQIRALAHFVAMGVGRDGVAEIAALARLIGGDDVAGVTRRLGMAAKPIGQPADPRAEIARRLQRWVRDAIGYVRDPGGREEFADALTIVQRGWDDCDGKSRLFVALVRALHDASTQARIRPVFKTHREFVHVQAEVRFPGSDRDARAEPGGWLLAELILAGVELGEDPIKTAKRDAAGQFVYAGPR